MNTLITLLDASSASLGSNDNTPSSTGLMTFPGTRCSRLSLSLQPGTYTVQVKGGFSTGPTVADFNPGTFRLQVRSGT